jgi:hypothetical protein
MAKWSCCVFIATALIATSSRADIVTYDFTGTVQGDYPGFASDGDPVTGIITYDLATPLQPFQPFSPVSTTTVATYQATSSSSPNTIQITINGHTIINSAEEIEYAVVDSLPNSLNVDEFDAEGSGLDSGTYFNFQDDSGNASSNDSLPSSLSLSSFDIAQFAYDDYVNNNIVVIGAFISLQLVVPEPSTIALLALASLGLLVRRKFAHSVIHR